MYLFLRVANNSIDGSCLELIEENDLIDDLGISSKIVRKKLMHCKYNFIRKG